MGQGVLGRYAPIKQMQGSTQQAMGADTGAVQPAAVQGLRAQIQAQPQAGKPPVGGATGNNSALQSLMTRMRGMNPALPGR